MQEVLSGCKFFLTNLRWKFFLTMERERERVITTYIFPEKNAENLSAFVKNGSAVIKSLKIWNLSGVNKI